MASQSHHHHHSHHSRAASINDDDLLANAIPIDTSEEDGQEENDEFAPIEVEGESDEPAASSRSGSKIHTFGEKSSGFEHHQWTRKPSVTGTGATHMKTFVTKLRLDAIDHLDEQVNEWLDAHPEYEVKFVTTSVGKLVGKMTEEALFMNVWV